MISLFPIFKEPQNTLGWIVVRRIFHCLGSLTSMAFGVMLAGCKVYLCSFIDDVMRLRKAAHRSEPLGTSSCFSLISLDGRCFQHSFLQNFKECFPYLSKHKVFHEQEQHFYDYYLHWSLFSVWMFNFIFHFTSSS